MLVYYNYLYNVNILLIEICHSTSSYYAPARKSNIEKYRSHMLQFINHLLLMNHFKRLAKFVKSKIIFQIGFGIFKICHIYFYWKGHFILQQKVLKILKFIVAPKSNLKANITQRKYLVLRKH